MQENEALEVLVIGAGVVGLAIARTYAMNGHQVIVAESEKMPGSIVSARNSGVIHAGIYYPQNTLKAKLCVEGKNKLYDYCKEKDIPHKNCTKLIVACNQNDVEKLQSIKERAENNGVSDLVFTSKNKALEMENELNCEEALCSPSTGIIDVHTYINALIFDIEEHGGTIALGNKIKSAHQQNDLIHVEFENGETIQCRHLVNAAGLRAQEITKNFENINKSSIPQQYLAKGNYFGISGKAPFSRLIYPVPEEGGLGAHFTMNMAGESLFGPDVEWIENDHDYSVDEKRSDKFYESVARFWPKISEKTLIPAYCGIRPKLTGPGQPDADFVIHTHQDHGIQNLTCLYGIESPGLTASLALADHVYQLNNR